MISEPLKDSERLPCAHCGTDCLRTGRDVFSIDDPAPFKPMFCSEDCANEFDPNVLDANKLKSLMSWFVPKSNA